MMRTQISWMSPAVRVRKVQVSVKLPPDIERNIKKIIDDGEYTNITDAITGILRLYFQSNKVEKLQASLDALKSDVDILKLRNENLEKLMCDLQDHLKS